MHGMTDMSDLKQVQWQTDEKPAVAPPSTEPYDSTADTEAHILEVFFAIEKVRSALQRRSEIHDQSKLVSPEKEAYDIITPRLRGLTYGSGEYRASLREMKPAIDHHYAHNSHHPEHTPDGIAGMDLIDLVEMFCDWYAGTKRHADGSLEKSIPHNQERFGISPQLTQILENTRRNLGWK